MIHESPPASLANAPCHPRRSATSLRLPNPAVLGGQPRGHPSDAGVRGPTSSTRRAHASSASARRRCRPGSTAKAAPPAEDRLARDRARHHALALVLVRAPTGGGAAASGERVARTRPLHARRARGDARRRRDGARARSSRGGPPVGARARRSAPRAARISGGNALAPSSARRRAYRDTPSVRAHAALAGRSAELERDARPRRVSCAAAAVLDLLAEKQAGPPPPPPPVRRGGRPSLPAAGGHVARVDEFAGDAPPATRAPRAGTARRCRQCRAPGGARPLRLRGGCAMGGEGRWA